MTHRQKYLSVRLLALAALLCTAPIQRAWAQTAPDLGTASDFAALGGTGVTCTSPFPPLPAITVTGDVGSDSAAPTSVTGFPGFAPGAYPCSIVGNIYQGVDPETTAYQDFLLAYTELATRSDLACPSSDATHNIDVDLIGKTLSPGVYCLGPVALLSGALTLDGKGDKNAVWIFKAATSITPIGGSVVMTGGGTACNVYWQANTSVSLDNTDFLGNILAGDAVTFTGVGSSLVGRALAHTSVTMTDANISMACGGAITTATEFYHPIFDHYFITAYQDEAANLAAGNLPPWVPTGKTFNVWTGPGMNITNVWRFFSASFAPKSGHFYTNNPTEAQGLQNGNVWTLEASDAFYMMASPAGLCPTGTIPLYRLYNNGQGGAPNHRYTVDPAIRSSMIAANWIPEGNGADGVFACVPP
jgi:Ice-binding-like